MKTGKRERFRDIWVRYGKYGICAGAGIILFLMAEIVDMQEQTVENGVLRRNPCGKGDMVYEFYVDGLEGGRMEASVTVPEQKMSEKEFRERIPEAAEFLCTQIRGENPSLLEVRYDLSLVREIPEYGMSVSWESKNPELVSHMGLINSEGIPKEGADVCLKAELSNGDSKESIEIPVRVFPRIQTGGEQFLEELNALILESREEDTVILPKTFEEHALKYRKKSHSQNAALIFLGILAAGCLWFREKNDVQEAKKKREDSLISDYPDLISGFLVLTGAGYSVKQAWKKLISDYKKSKRPGDHPVYEEMEIALNQMETGTPEVQAYADFGRRCGLRCYMKFASLLESCLNTGGKNLRKLLESEMENAFKERADLARRKGEEASTKLLLPMFGMLGIVMVMVVAPAFLSLG